MLTPRRAHQEQLDAARTEARKANEERDMLVQEVEILNSQIESHGENSVTLERNYAQLMDDMSSQV